MMIPEDDRFELYESLRRAVGERSAATLMTQVFGMDPERVATKEDLAVVRGEIAELRGEVRDEIAAVRLDSARQSRQLTLTLLIAFLAHFAATAGLVLSLG